MSFVKCQRGPIVDRGFQAHRVATGCMQFLFRSLQQQRTHSQASRRRKHINGDHVPRRPDVRDNKAVNLAVLRIGGH